MTSYSNYANKCNNNPIETYGDFAIVKVTSGDTPTANVKISSNSSYYANGTYSTVPEGTYVYKYGAKTKYSYGLAGQTGCVYTYETSDLGVSPLKCRGLTQVTMVSGDVANNYIDGGDSGGCAFLKVNGSYKISGLVTARPKSGSTAHTVMYYTPIGYATEIGFKIAS